jgi:predicted HicB family RNase H-like nuclease
MSKTKRHINEAEHPERVQLLVRVPKDLHRALKHAAIDYDSTVNDLVVGALEKWWASNRTTTLVGRETRVARHR